MKGRRFRRDQRPHIRPCFIGHPRLFVHQQKPLEHSVRCGDADSYNNKKLDADISCVAWCDGGPWISCAVFRRQPIDRVLCSAHSLGGNSRSAQPPATERDNSASPTVSSSPRYPSAGWFWRRILSQQPRDERCDHCSYPQYVLPTPEDVVVELCRPHRLFPSVLRRALS